MINRHLCQDNGPWFHFQNACERNQKSVSYSIINLKLSFWTISLLCLLCCTSRPFVIWWTIHILSSTLSGFCMFLSGNHIPTLYLQMITASHAIALKLNGLMISPSAPREGPGLGNMHWIPTGHSSSAPVPLHPSRRNFTCQIDINLPWKNNTLET